jgi:hypothetical protein
MLADTNSIPNIEIKPIDVVHDHLQQNFYLTINNNTILTGDIVSDYNFNSIAPIKTYTTIKISW